LYGSYFQRHYNNDVMNIKLVSYVANSKVVCNSD